MSTVWFSLKKSFHCKSDSSEVHDPKTKKQLSAILTRKPGKWGCSRSIKDVINGNISKRSQSENHINCSPRSIGSSEFLNPITHEVILNNNNNNSNSKCELKISATGAGAGAGDGIPVMQYFKNTPPRGNLGKSNMVLQKGRRSSERDSGGGGGGVTCHKCGKEFSKWESLEAHHLSKHAVTELMEGDSSRKIVEIICRSSWIKLENPSGLIEKILKVHNMQKTLARFEEYRELVKTKASKLPKKHPRCIADGNELLRFYGATISCSLGLNGCSSLCVSDKCCVCRIIREGFSTKRELKGGIGIFTSSTSVRAFESIEVLEENADTRKALIVCRVIAGRVHRPLENIQEMAGQTGFDSLAGKVGLYSNIEELYLLSPKALLPCFVVTCKP